MYIFVVMGLISRIKGIVSRTPRTVILIRGVSGSGKSTLAATLSRNGKYPVLAADDYFIQKDGSYKWNPELLGRAHKSCQERCKKTMTSGKRLILVNNTFTKAKDLRPYINMAELHGYMVFSVVVENRSNTKNIHNVPIETVLKMSDELMNSIKLISDDTAQIKKSIILHKDNEQTRN